MTASAALLLDTGPLVAFLNARDAHHAWARAELGRTAPPLLTCEAVLSEACFLLRGLAGGPAAVLALVERGLLRASYRADADAKELVRLLRKYADLPISFADACLVRMAEEAPGRRVLTLDRHFQIYRRAGRQRIPVILPDETP